jgi:Mrp family chromosome partitioning ATPase
VSKIFEALNQAAKEKSKSQPPKVSWRTKVGPPQVVGEPNIPDASAEEYGRLRQQITDLLPAGTSRVLMFVSPSETTDSADMVVGFGYTMAWIGETAILVDVNRRRPILHKVFGSDQEPGMMELASGMATVEEATQDTGVKRLSLVPAGAQPIAAFSANEKALLTNALNAFRTSANWIILYGPSASAVNDIEALAGMVDGVVLVIQAEKTRWEAALSAKEHLQKAGANILGAVFTGRRNRIPAWLNRRL